MRADILGPQNTDVITVTGITMQTEKLYLNIDV
jgi:hypothetical protein